MVAAEQNPLKRSTAQSDRRTVPELPRRTATAWFRSDWKATASTRVLQSVGLGPPPAR